MKTIEIVEKLNKLPENLLQSASDYIDYLLEKAGKQATEEKPVKRKLGFAKGEAKMLPGFDDPLDEMKEYME